jgi:BA14K-like protein
MRNGSIGAAALACAILSPSFAALAEERGGPAPPQHIEQSDCELLHNCRAGAAPRYVPPNQGVVRSPAYNGRGYGDRWGNHGDGFAAGVATGALLGGVLAAPRPRYYPAPADGYYADAPAEGYDPPPDAYPTQRVDAADYCARRYRSYDRRSGTYVGYDGYRHPCP